MTTSSSERVEQIEAWQSWLDDNGIPSFPLYGIMNGKCRCTTDACPSPGKHPKIQGWRTLTHAHPAGVFDNLGVSTDHLVVVDIDSGFTIPGDLPETLTISTGRGLHLWYRADPHHRIGNAAGWRPKIDIRSYGGLVAAPPSRHISGSVYAYHSGESIEPVPSVVLDSFQARQDRQRIDPVTSIPNETSDLMRPFGESLATQMLEALPGERNPTLFKVACRFFEGAASGWLGEDTLAEIYQAAIQVGLSPSEIAATVESASRSLTKR